MGPDKIYVASGSGTVNSAIKFSACCYTYFGQQNELASCESRTKPQTSLRMRLALYQPDIPQNTGTILRLCGCLGIEVHIIEPVGFPSTDRAFRRAGMDYLQAVTITRHASWQDFEAWRRAAACRLILFTTKAARSYLDFNFAPDDVLLFGRESAGAPETVHAAADARLLIPMRPGMRSLNVAIAAAIGAGEALRQTGGIPAPSRNLNSQL